MPEPDQTELDKVEGPKRVILLDTNCFLRLYHSPVRPFLGTVIGGNRLMTLNSLIGEFMKSPRLQELYAWVVPNLNLDIEVEGAILAISEENKALVAENYALHLDYARQLIDAHCEQRGIRSRALSRCDLELLATGITLGTLIATDEWPLKLVIEDLVSDPEGGYNIRVITSLDVVAMLEKSGKLIASDRRETVKSWIRNQEILPRGWEDTYQSLFDEKPPRL